VVVLELRAVRGLEVEDEGGDVVDAAARQLLPDHPRLLFFFFTRIVQGTDCTVSRGRRTGLLLLLLYSRYRS